jgi:DNA-binding transcriptional ArsR family regulator
MPNLPARRVINTLEQFKAISDPTRSRILNIIQNQPATAKQIADRLGATPGAIGHHLRVLEEAGLAQVMARRLVRGIVASYYTRTAKIFNFDFPKELSGGESACTEIMERAYDEMAESLQAYDGDPFLRDGFPHVRVSPERAQHFWQRLDDLIEEILQETPDPNGDVYGIFVGMFKSPPYMQGEGHVSEQRTTEELHEPVESDESNSEDLTA